MTTPLQRVLWANKIQRECLLEAGEDVEIGLAAADYILSTQPIPDHHEQVAKVEEPVPLVAISRVVQSPINAFFAHDIANSKAQGILNRSLKAAKNLSAEAREQLAAALAKSETDNGEAILAFIDEYRLQLAKLLTTTQLASLLEGAREVATDLPTLATFPGAVPPPPSLEPKEAAALVDRLAAMSGDARAKVIYELTPAEQQYVTQAIAAKEAGPPEVPPTFTPPSGPAGDPEAIHYPVIDEAARALSEKNVLTRERYDALDAAARSKALTVAGVDAEETLTKIRDALAENVSKGADYATFKQAVLAAVDEGTFLSDGHLETTFRTNVQSAFSDGQMVVLQNPLVKGGFPYSAYDSIHDDRVRHDHRALDTAGIGGSNVYRNDDPVFQLFRPPWSWNCRCSWTPLTIRQAAEKGISEAEKWLDTGVEPAQPAHVKMPDFQPPPGFQRAISSAPLSIRLSILSLSVIDEYPRDRSNRFLDKLAIAEAARDPAKAAELRESIPEGERWKLDVLVSRLQWGGLVHHPRESPGLAVGADGAIADPKWAEYAIARDARDTWEDNEADRKERRKAVDHFIKVVRAGHDAAKVARTLEALRDPPDDLHISDIRDKLDIVTSGRSSHLDDVDNQLVDAGASDAEVREVARLRHRAEAKVAAKDEAYIAQLKRSRRSSATLADKEKLADLLDDLASEIQAYHAEVADLYEEIAEAAYKRIEEESATDIEPAEPEEPGEADSVALIGPAFGAGQSSDGQWITIGGHAEGEEKHVGGFRVLIDKSGTIVKGRLRGTKVRDVKSRFDEIKGKKRGQQPERGQPGVEQPAARPGTGTGGAGSRGGAARDSGQVAPAPGGPSPTAADQGGVGDDQPAGDRTAKRAAAAIPEITRRIERIKNLFWDTDKVELTSWLDTLLEHINAVGAQTVLDSLGEQIGTGERPTKTQYRGADKSDPVWGEGELNVRAFTNAYLDRAGIIALPGAAKAAARTPVVSVFTENTEDKGRKPLPGDFAPTPTSYKNKLEEAKLLPGLESSEDLDKATGQRVTHLTPEVMKKLDAKYGDGKWIVKSYRPGSEAGKVGGEVGIFFPQYANRIASDARITAWSNEEFLNTIGYQVIRNQNETPVGIRHNSGRSYKFGSQGYTNKVGGEAREAADAIVESLKNMNGATLPNNGRQFMVQPAFPVVGVTEEDRAMGKTWSAAREGRVHIVTRNGRAEVVPHATWYKEDSLPVVFETDDSRAMAKAAQDAVSKLPESDRNGQIYGTDLIPTPNGYRVVELNPSVEGGGSAFLGLSPFTIDALISHLSGREPEHVRFIRRLLSDRVREPRQTAAAPESAPTSAPAPEPAPPTPAPEPTPAPAPAVPERTADTSKPAVDYGSIAETFARGLPPEEAKNVSDAIKRAVSATDADIKARLEEINSQSRKAKGSAALWNERQGLESILYKRQKAGVSLALDAEGHEHKGKGKGGGQFTGKGNSGGSKGGSDPIAGASKGGGKRKGSKQPPAPATPLPTTSQTSQPANQQPTMPPEDDDPFADVSDLDWEPLGATTSLQNWDQRILLEWVAVLGKLESVGKIQATNEEFIRFADPDGEVTDTRDRIKLLKSLHEALHSMMTQYWLVDRVPRFDNEGLPLPLEKTAWRVTPAGKASLPVIKEELERRAEGTDWRPNEILPEDYYSAGPKRPHGKNWESVRKLRAQKSQTGDRGSKSEEEWRADPTLSKLGDKLDIRHVNNWVVQEHLTHLSKVSPDLMESLVNNGLVGVFVGAVPVTELDDNGELKGVTPPGYPENMTWDTFSGCYTPSRGACAGSGDHLSASIALHELGHGVGDKLTIGGKSINNSKELIAHHKQLYDMLSPYYQQDGSGGKTGRKELLAEGFAQTIMNRKRAVELYDEEFVVWMEGILSNKPDKK